MIRENVFEDNDGPNVLITSARDVMLAANRFVRAMQRESTRGAERSVIDGALIQIRECEGVKVEGNSVVEPGKAMQEKLRAEQSNGVETESAFLPR